MKEALQLEFMCISLIFTKGREQGHFYEKGTWAPLRHISKGKRGDCLPASGVPGTHSDTFVT